MTHHIVCLVSANDTFTPQIKNEDQLILVPFYIAGHPDSIQNSVSGVLAEYNCKPSLNVYDLLHAAVSAYTADVRVSRKSAFDGWTRDFALYLAVQNLTGWEEGAKILEKILSFLTGDRWKVNVRPVADSYKIPLAQKPQTIHQLKTNNVCLFSGGLDSFIGVIDQIQEVGQVALVGHHSAGAGATSSYQAKALSTLRKYYSEQLTPFLKFWISPPKGATRASETTTRGRSILFLALGIAVADGLGAKNLIVPENGFISLNVPLTNSRLGSFSTRTTHPHLINLLRQLLTAISIQVKVILPYRFLTKGEMLQKCANKNIITEGLKDTMSCSHPGASRYTSKRNNIHCGYCVPCLIRRAAIISVGHDPTEYFVRDLHQQLSVKRGSDLRSIKMAVDRYNRKSPRLSDVLIAGPLPGSDSELQAYFDIYCRGINEVKRLLTS